MDRFKPFIIFLFLYISLISQYILLSIEAGVGDGKYTPYIIVTIIVVTSILISIIKASINNTYRLGTLFAIFLWTFSIERVFIIYERGYGSSKYIYVLLLTLELVLGLYIIFKREEEKLRKLNYMGYA